MSTTTYTPAADGTVIETIVDTYADGTVIDGDSRLTCGHCGCTLAHTATRYFASDRTANRHLAGLCLEIIAAGSYDLLVVDYVDGLVSPEPF